MSNLFFNTLFIPDPVNIIPVDPPPTITLPSPEQFFISRRSGTIRGGDQIEVNSFNQIEDSERNDSLQGAFEQNWLQQGNVEVTEQGTILSSSLENVSKITHPITDFQSFVVKVDFTLQVNSLKEQDFFSFKFVSGNNFISVRIANSNGFIVVQAETLSNGIRRLGRSSNLTSRIGTLTIAKAGSRAFALLNESIILETAAFSDVIGSIELFASSKNEDETSIVNLRNFRDLPGVLLGNNFVLNQKLSSSYGITGTTPEVDFTERGIRDATIFGRFGEITQPNMWNYFLPVGVNLRTQGTFTANFYGNKGRV